MNSETNFKPKRVTDPNDRLDEDGNWTMTAESEEFTYFSVEYTFREYKNSNVKSFE